MDFLRLGESLAQNELSEAGLRSAVSRVYYAVFHTVRVTLRVQGRRNIHNRVIDELTGYDWLAGIELDALRDLRNTADYRLDVDLPMADWDRNYRNARQSANYVLERLE